MSVYKTRKPRVKARYCDKNMTFDQWMNSPIKKTIIKVVKPEDDIKNNDNNDRPETN